jgi:hypothetical protein
LEEILSVCFGDGKDTGYKQVYFFLLAVTGTGEKQGAVILLNNKGRKK